MPKPTPTLALRQLPSHPTTVAVAVVFVLSLAIGLIQGDHPFYYDSGEYWRLSGTFTESGHFSLFDFDAGIRGYALPLTYLVFQEASGVLTDDDGLVVLLFNSVLFALIGAVLAPALARLAWPQLEWSAARRILLGVLLLVFWSGYLNYPLSDFFALAAAMLAIVAAASGRSPGWMLSAGLAAGLALNARPSYLLLTPLLIALVLWDWREQHRAGKPEARRRLLCICLFLLGLAAVSVPQSLIQNRASDGLSPIPGGSGLASFQYTAGLELQRYETYVGAEEGLVTPQMRYRDPHTADLLAGLEEERVSGTAEYLELTLTHPVTMAGVFLRHVVNGLDQRYTTPYVKQLEPPERRLLRLAGFLIVFLALLRLCWPAARRSLGPARWRYPLVLLLAATTSIASAIETRFMLPVFVLALILLLAPGWPNPLATAETGPRRYRALAVISATALVYLLIVWTIASQATDNLRLV